MKFGFENPLGVARERINKVMSESRLPNQNYESTVGVYGGRIKQDEAGHMIYDMGGPVSKVDQAGDIFLRNYDEHVMKDPWDMLRRHPKMFFKFFMPGPKRYRGRPNEIMNNVRNLGLEEYYGEHEKGLEILKPELYTQGTALQDIYKADLIGNEALMNIDRFEAVRRAGVYLAQIHEKTAVGEVLVSDVIFMSEGEDKLAKPVLNLPDIVYNQDKETAEIDKRATDLLDFIVNIGMEEARRSEGDEASVSRALDALLTDYNDYKTLMIVISYIKRGRLMLAGDRKNENLDYPEGSPTKENSYLFSQHNVARMGNRDQNLDVMIKNLSLQALQKKCDILKN
ncbi:MAG: hypothetical protein WCV69_00460 [Patescibacteria group bacterium]|jgi:hypothetical protein